MVSYDVRRRHGETCTCVQSGRAAAREAQLEEQVRELRETVQRLVAGKVDAAASAPEQTTPTASPVAPAAIATAERAHPRLSVIPDAEYHIDEARAVAQDADGEQNCTCSFEGLGGWFSPKAKK